MDLGTGLLPLFGFLEFALMLFLALGLPLEVFLRDGTSSHGFLGTESLVYRLAYSGDIAAGQLTVFQGGPF